MDHYTAGIMMLLTLGLMGLAFLLVGIVVNIAHKKKIERCTASVEGHVVRHVFRGEKGGMFPRVEYTVDGVTYQQNKRFAWITTTEKISIRGPLDNDAWEDEKGNLHIRRDMIVSYRDLAQKLWPIGSAMSVWYDPGKPKTSYVERPVRSAVGFAFLLVGAIGIALGVLMFVLLTVLNL